MILQLGAKTALKRALKSSLRKKYEDWDSNPGPIG